MYYKCCGFSILLFSEFDVPTAKTCVDEADADTPSSQEDRYILKFVKSTIDLFVRIGSVSEPDP